MIVDVPQQTVLQKRPVADRTKHIACTTIFIKRTAIEFLQALFSTRDPGNFHYDKDNTRGDIQICDQFSLDEEAVDRRPAIVGIRGPINGQNLGLGGNNVQALDRRTGNTTKTDLLVGSVAFSCLSTEGLEAEMLANEVYVAFKTFGKALAKHGYFQIKSLNIGGETLVEQEGYKDLSVVPVYVAASVQDRWTVEPEAVAKLEKIVFDILTTP